jgi:predicted ATPase/class 3 adenylate cyclase
VLRAKSREWRRPEPAFTAREMPLGERGHRRPPCYGSSPLAASVEMSQVHAVLLTDIVGSTQLSEALGDAAAAALWTAHDRAARDLLRRWHGREIDKSDGLLLLFETAADAVAYAIDYHRALAQLTPALRARAGLHVGPVSLRENSASDVARGAKPLEVDGIAKPTAARTMALAAGGQTLLTAQARRALGPTPLKVQSHGHWVMKGIGEPMELFEVVDGDRPFAAPADADKAYRVARAGERWLPVAQVPGNLPQPLTSFIGRVRELDELRALVDDVRLLTLTGSGGCGKTRLALQAAAEARGLFADGVWVVELAALSDPALVPQTAATVLGLKEEAGHDMTQTLARQIGSSRTLVVLDNAEHVLDACATLAAALLRHCSGLLVLVSSREPLGLAGERVYRVPSLELPDAQGVAGLDRIAACESVRLFVERAQAQVPRFELTAQNAPTVASICRRLDGIPFAIELAAARTRSLTVGEVHARLDQRFRLLTGGSRTALPRQQTLRALIDWSYDQLAEPERALLCRLSVFAGGWALEAAEGVHGESADERAAVLERLVTLVDKSLVLAEERGGTSRYRLLESVRQYARDRLLERGESDRWRDRHAEHFLALGEAAEARLATREQRAWLERLELEHDNLRAALTWTCSQPGSRFLALRLAGALAMFWEIRGHPAEGRRWLSETLAASPHAPAAVRAKALAGAGVLAREQADYDAAEQLFGDALALNRALGERRGIASLVNDLGSLRRERGDYAGARTRFEESLAIRRELGDRRGIASSLNSLGLVFRELGDYGHARPCYEESLAIDREVGDRLDIAVSLNNLGAMEADLCNHAAARALHEEALAIRRELGNRRGIASSLTNLGNVLQLMGARAEARQLLEESLEIRRGLGDRRGAAVSLWALGNVAADAGDFAGAERLHAESLATRRALGDRWGMATSLNELGALACRRGDLGAARAHYAESLHLETALGDRWDAIESLSGLASVAHKAGRPARAALLWGAAERLREEVGAPMPEPHRESYDAQVASARGALADDAAFEAAWREGRSLGWEAAAGVAIAER